MLKWKQMYPNQQQNPGPQPTPPPQQPVAPQPPSAYSTPVPQTYDPNYLDTIAPPPPQAKFLSGTFGKLFWVLIGVFVLAVSLIIAFSGKDETADLQQVAVRLENFSKTVKQVKKNITSKNLKNINTNFEIWLSGNQAEAENLLNLGGVKKTQYNKEMVRKETALAEELNEEFENARLAARLNRVYARTMAAETEEILNMLNAMAKKNKSSQIREFAKKSADTLATIQKNFSEYTDDGN